MNEVNETLQRMIKPIGEEDTDSCRALWIAVITQQLIDARSMDKKSEAKARKRDALEWLSDRAPESGFSDACHLAGLNPELLQERVSYFIDHPESPIDFRCKRKGVSRSEPTVPLVALMTYPRQHTRVGFAANPR